jgi:hypothetical protein
VSGYPWLKLWNEALEDDKFDAAADMAGSTVPIATFAFLRACTAANQNENRGSFAGLHLQVIASRCKVPLDEIRRLFQAFRELRMVIGERIANWAKRNSEKAQKRRTANAERVARHRAKQAAVAAQPELDLPSPLQPPDPLQSSITFAAEEEGESQRIPESVSNSESVAAREGSFETDEGIPFGRDAPLEQPPESNVVQITASPAAAAMKAKKKELRRQKVIRFINATRGGEDQRVRLEGMFGCDPIHDDQWWFDKCDAERLLAKWDDVRDKGDSWQRSG